MKLNRTQTSTKTKSRANESQDISATESAPSFDDCLDQLRDDIKAAEEQARAARRAMERCAETLIRNVESRGIVHLEDLLEIAHETSFAAVIEVTRTWGGYLSDRADQLEALHELEKRQGRARPSL